MKRQRFSRSAKKSQAGSALIDIAISYATLVIVAMLALKASVNAASTQSWTVKQAMSDAYLSRESALAQRIPFDQLNTEASLWPLYPDKSTSTVSVGKLPGGRNVLATLHRTRIPDPNNLSTAGGNGTASSNPAEMESWKLQSLLVYDIRGRNYVKSRTTLRIR